MTQANNSQGEPDRGALPTPCPLLYCCNGKKPWGHAEATDSPQPTESQANHEPKSKLAPANSQELREKLAAIEHERWADWQKWMHGTFLTRTDGNMKYRTVLPVRLVDRWERQIATPYAELSDEEKASDMEQVDRYWPLIEAHTQTLIQEARIDENESMKESVTHGYSRDDWCINHEKHVSQCYACREAKWGNIFCRKFEAIIDDRLKDLHRATLKGDKNDE